MELPDGGFDRLPAWLYRRSGWMAQLVPGIGVCGSRLQSLLDDPAFVALAAASPQIARMLRSLCRMLAVDPGAALPPPPPRKRPPPAKPETEAAAMRPGAPVHLPDHYPPGLPRPGWARQRRIQRCMLIPRRWIEP
jgi:hypothetical protein